MVNSVFIVVVLELAGFFSDADDAFVLVYACNAPLIRGKLRGGGRARSYALRSNALGSFRYPVGDKSTCEEKRAAVLHELAAFFSRRRGTSEKLRGIAWLDFFVVLSTGYV